MMSAERKHTMNVRTLFVLVALFFFAALPVSAQSARISEDQARRIALQHVPNGTIEEIELDREDGRDVYEVEVRDPDGNEHDLEIDASTGAVLRAEVDRDDD